MKYEDFIIKARKKHGDKYEYPAFDICRTTEKITIICPEHGSFEQSIYPHLKGQGCPKCARNQTLTTEEFIERAKAFRGDEYDYSKTVYINKRTKVCVIDKNGNERWCLPGALFTKRKKRTHKINRTYKTNQDYIDYVSKIHNNKYDYSKTIYKSSNDKVTIICPEHGEFKQTANNHAMGHGCPMCSKNKKLTIKEFVTRANKIHNDKYEYRNIHFNSCNDNISIICPEHGEFTQNVQHHLSGTGCPKCARNKTLTTDEFIERAKSVHGDKYDYSKTVYVNLTTPVTIICKEHGEFKQLPSVHLAGNGCPICHESRMESYLTKLLSDNSIEYIKQKRFKWLGRQSLDFYIPSLNIAIECQGRQHFEDIEFFNNSFDYTSDMDINKFKLCKDNNIKIYYLLPHTKIDISPINSKFEIYTKNNTFYNYTSLIEKIKGTV